MDEPKGGGFKTRISVYFHLKLEQLALFIFNKHTKELLGRTCKSWAQLLLFFSVFYSAVGGFFVVHTVVFMCLTPQPAENITPWNFGRYAYTNFPNAKIALISVPKSIVYDGGQVVLSSANKAAIENLLDSAEASGVSSHCRNSSSEYGYSTGQPCVYIRISRVFQWSPDLINSSLADAPTLPLACSGVPPGSGITLFEEQAGIPLNLTNSNSRSFPFRGQPNYTTPLMSLMLDFSAVTSLDGSSSYQFDTTCGLYDLTLSVGERELDHNAALWYEAPADLVVPVSIKL